MTNSAALQLPYLAAGQAQKHVTVNEGLRKLDAIVQLSVVSATTTAQPGSPTDGDVYIVPSGKSGAQWSSFSDNALGYYRDGAWEQITPREGWLAWVKDADQLLHWTGAAWALFAPGKLLTVSATDRILGRSTAGAGAAEEIACTAAGRALIDDADARSQCATLGSWRVLAASAVAASHTGDTSETALATVAVPAGAMGANGALRVTSTWSYPTSANTKTLRYRMGGIAGAALLEMSATTTRQTHAQRTVQNRNSEGSQVASSASFSGSFGLTNVNDLFTAAVDTAAAWDLVLSGQLASAGETITLQSYLVELFHAA